ncbi:MAG TPA: bacteriocin fulvocin C-related protein [Pyrinomonadaceae bacterium]|jgi:hypothetical protein
MKKIQLLAVTAFLLLSSLTALGQYSQTVVNNYATVNSKGSVAERKLFVAGLTDSETAELWRYHIDQRAAYWNQNAITPLTNDQTAALAALKSALTSTVVNSAETLAETDSTFDDLNAALEELTRHFTEAQIAEFTEILGSAPSTLEDAIYQDQSTNEFYALQCPRGKICWRMCDCAVTSLFCGSGCMANACTAKAEGCGCFWLWSCSGLRIR